MTTVSRYEDLLIVLRAQRVSLGMPLLEVDERAGFQSGYVGKLESFEVGLDGRRKPNTKAISIVNLFNWMGAIGLAIEVVEVDATTTLLHTPLDIRRRAVLEPHLEKWSRGKVMAWARSAGKKGGPAAAKVASKRLGKGGRRARAKRAARARWAKVKTKAKERIAA